MAETDSQIVAPAAETAPAAPVTETVQPLPAELPRGTIIFYCKACKKQVEAQRQGKKYQYKCPDCKSSDIAFGTEHSIRSYYRL